MGDTSFFQVAIAAAIAAIVVGVWWMSSKANKTLVGTVDGLSVGSATIGGHMNEGDQLTQIGFLTYQQSPSLLTPTVVPILLPLFSKKGAYVALPDERLGATVGAKIVDTRGTVERGRGIQGLVAGQRLDVVPLFEDCVRQLVNGDRVAVPAYGPDARFEVALY